MTIPLETSSPPFRQQIMMEISARLVIRMGSLTKGIARSRPTNDASGCLGRFFYSGINSFHYHFWEPTGSLQIIVPACPNARSISFSVSKSRLNDAHPTASVDFITQPEATIPPEPPSMRGSDLMSLKVKLLLRRLSRWWLGHKVKVQRVYTRVEGIGCFWRGSVFANKLAGKQDGHTPENGVVQFQWRHVRRRVKTRHIRHGRAGCLEWLAKRYAAVGIVRLADHG